MHTTTSTRGSLRFFVSALILAVLMASLLVVVPPAQSASAQEEETSNSLVVWDIEGGLVDNPKTWRFTQSTAGNDLGSASAAAPGLDDSAWTDVELRWKTVPGPFVANHFRKDFTLAEIGVELFEIEAIQVSVNYDDTMVMYLNGVEVYRSIRGNLDPTYALYPLGTNIPYNVEIPYGGFETFYVDIPNIDGLNDCEFSGPTCSASPYGGPDTPAIPVDLLNEDGINTWAVTTWNRSGVLDADGNPTTPGSGDSTINHVFELVIDPDAVPPNPIFINEVMAANDQAVPINIDDDPELEYPDWFELHNVSNDPVDMAGWTITDNAATWNFPSVVIPANSYLLVAASDRDRTDLPVLQTNFKLSREDDSLRLTNPEGFLADEYALMPRQFDDNSFGRPSDTGTPTYLDTFTPGASNSVAGDGYDPILRLFKNRLYNEGESVTHQIDAFDPDGDSLSYAISPLPAGLGVDSTTGEITGTLTASGPTTSTITVTDSDGDVATQPVQWVVFPAITGVAPIVLNEYNAVADDRELVGGSGVVGNGGDWFEFLVLEDDLDLRGYRFELYDNKGDDDQLRQAAVVTVGNDPVLANAPAGTIITISEEGTDDLSFNGNGDWLISLAITNEATGTYFATPANDVAFNSTRASQMVLVKDATGTVVTPLSGETEAWDDANGGVSGGEVMALCVSPTPGVPIDPITDYLDTGIQSTFGEANECAFQDPNAPDGISGFSQDLSALRASASLGAGRGDANCDGQLTILDAVLIAQYTVGLRTDSGPCAFGNGGNIANGEMYVNGVDMNDDGQLTVFDAVAIARCNVGIDDPWCP